MWPRARVRGDITPGAKSQGRGEGINRRRPDKA